MYLWYFGLSNIWATVRPECLVDRVRLKTRVSGAGRGRTGRKLTTAKIHIIKTNRKSSLMKSGVDFPVVANSYSPAPRYHHVYFQESL